MRAAASRALMALAACCLGEERREWAAAMEAELDVAIAEGRSLSFASGCLIAAWRDMATREEGRLTLASHAVALGLMIPMAAVQIGCALFGFPYLYPGRDGLAGAVLVGGEHMALLRSLYQAAVPSLALLLILLGAGHLCIAWAMLDRDWIRVRRVGAFTLAVAMTLILFMGVLFLDSSQAVLQAAVLALELTIVWLVARWHARLPAAATAAAEDPG